MAKPRHTYNRPDTSKMPGEGGLEAGLAEVEVEERGGKQGCKAVDLP